jgi:DNA invertase Pin-like site-specific DNA recombinase
MLVSVEKIKAAVYCRISSDVSGEALGVARQEADARKLCADLGWEVAEVFCDNDRSAYSRKPRPRYLAMLQAIRDRRVNGVVAWHPDRLHRQTRELVSFIDLVTDHRIEVQTVTAGRYDLTTPSGRLNARLLGSVGEFESEHKSERIRRKLQENAAQGKHHGGSRPYGWLKDRVTIDPDEAKAVREASRLVLGGESIKGTARALNAAGYTTATGRPWLDVTVRTMLRRPRNAGLRVHHGVVVGDGQWQPILTPEEYWRIEALLSNPARRTNPGRDGKVHLLSTIARCGVCDGPVVVSLGKKYRGVAKRVYRCRAAHVIRDQEFVDDLVTRVVVGRLSMDDASDLLAEPTRADAARVAAVRAQELLERLNDAAQAYARRTISLAQLEVINAALRPEIEAAQDDSVSPANRSEILCDLVGAADPAVVWEKLSPARRRAVVDLLVDVRIFPTKRGPSFDPTAVQITLR